MALSDGKISYYAKKASIVQSMSRKENCLDNSIIENFLGILKSEFYYKKRV